MNQQKYKVSSSTAFFGRTVPDIVHFYAEANIDAYGKLPAESKSLGQYDLEALKMKAAAAV